VADPFGIAQPHRGQGCGPDTFDAGLGPGVAADVARGQHPHGLDETVLRQLPGEPCLDREIACQIGIAHLAPDNLAHMDETGPVRGEAQHPLRRAQIDDKPGVAQSGGQKRHDPTTSSG
jgi:hypothetical protein